MHLLTRLADPALLAAADPDFGTGGLGAYATAFL